MNTKMSDVFELPITDNGRNNLITQHRDETEAAILAINSYDVNQQLIITLYELVDFDTKKILEDCKTIDSQKGEIEALRSALQRVVESESPEDMFHTAQCALDETSRGKL